MNYIHCKTVKGLVFGQTREDTCLKNFETRALHSNQCLLLINNSNKTRFSMTTMKTFHNRYCNNQKLPLLRIELRTSILEGLRSSTEL